MLVAFVVSFAGGFCIGLFGQLMAIIVASILYGLVFVQQLAADTPTVTSLSWLGSLVTLQAGYVAGTILRPFLNRRINRLLRSCHFPRGLKGRERPPFEP
jgi:hypothetical protein